MFSEELIYQSGRKSFAARAAERKTVMKAIMVPKPFELAFADLPKPELRSEGDVLIRVLGGGICGSDIGIFNGTNSLASYPRLIGHEYGGVVEAAGSGVTGLAAGDLVAVDPVVSCGHCRACVIGRHNVCESLEVTGVHRDGGFSEYVCIPQGNVHRLEKGTVDPLLACLVEPFSIGVQVNDRGRIGVGDKVVVFGSGPIGLCVLQVAKSRGAQVLMTDLLDSRLERAGLCGADRTVNSGKEDMKAAVLAFTDGVGAHVVVDSVCIPSSFEEALEIAAPAGRVVTLGLSDRPSSIAEVAITKKELDVVGSRLSNYKFPDVIGGFRSGALKPELLCTHKFPMDKAAEAFELIRTSPQDVCKIVLTF